MRLQERLIGMRRLFEHRQRPIPKRYNGKRQHVTVPLFLLCVIAHQLCICQAGKVLVLTTPLGVSHIVNLRKLAEELAQQRGHQITVSSSYSDQPIH